MQTASDGGAGSTSSSAPAASSAPVANYGIKTQITAVKVLAWIQFQKVPVGKGAIRYTEETDLNKLLGRPHQYVEKVAWKDDRIEGDVGTDGGGTIEIFANEADCKTRADYVEKVTGSMSMLTEYDYRRGPILVRLSHKLTPSQARDYEAALASLP